MLAIASASVGFHTPTLGFAAAAPRAQVAMGTPDQFTLAVLGDLHVSCATRAAALALIPLHISDIGRIQCIRPVSFRY